MKPGDILRETAALIEGGREEAHGKSEVTHADIARLWNAYLETIDHADLTAGDVALMMVLLKIARALNGQFNIDDFCDMAGYAALAGSLMDPGESQDKLCRSHSGDPVKRAVDDRLGRLASSDFVAATRGDEELKRAARVVRDFWRSHGVTGNQESSS